MMMKKILVNLAIIIILFQLTNCLNPLDICRSFRCKGKHRYQCDEKYLKICEKTCNEYRVCGINEKTCNEYRVYQKIHMHDSSHMFINMQKKMKYCNSMRKLNSNK